ncbi:hypothetical protein [Micromonospora chersina]
MNAPLAPLSPVGADLVTPDPGAACEFYAGLLGWTGTPTAAGVTAYRDGVRAADIRRGAGPARWWTVLGAADPAAVGAAAQRAGGRVARDEVRDPLGGGFRVRAGAAAMVPGPGRPCWYEYMTADAATADRFHADALGLRAAAPPGTPEDSYALLTADGAPVAGRLTVPRRCGTCCRPAGWSTSPSPTPMASPTRPGGWVDGCSCRARS